MAFLNKIGNILRQNAAKHSVSDLQFSKLSICQAVRYMSSMSSSKIFIGGLSFSTDDQSLREAFTKYGEVIEARVIVDRETGRSRGFGFVTYTSGEEAASAIQAVDGQDLHGRRVRVNYANDRTRGGGGYGGGGGGYGGGYGGGGGNYAGSGGFGSGGGGYSGGTGSYGSGGYSGTGYGSSSGGNYTGNYGSSDNQSSGGNYGNNSYGSGATSGGYGGNQFSSGAGIDFGSGNANSLEGNYNAAGGVGGPENSGNGGFGGNAQVGQGGANLFGEQTQDEPVNLNERDDEDDEVAKRG